LAKETLSVAVSDRFPGFECRNANGKIAEHPRNHDTVGAAHAIAVVFPVSFAVRRIIVAVRFAFSDFRIAQWLDSHLPLGFARGFKRRYIAHTVREDASRLTKKH
jgi:hypothetical protein